MVVWIVWSIDETRRRTFEGVYTNKRAALDKAYDLNIYFEDMGWHGLDTQVARTIVQEH